MPRSTRSTWFAVAAGAIALHVVDDSFLQPQPGTSAADHLFSGLIPLAILALPPRPTRGSAPARPARSPCRWCLPALLSGAEAIYYGGKTGLSGDDYTGLLAMAAAPVLLVLGMLGSLELAPHRRPPGRALRAPAAQDGRACSSPRRWSCCR